MTIKTTETITYSIKCRSMLDAILSDISFMTLRLNASNLQMTNNSTYVRSHFGR